MSLLRLASIELASIAGAVLVLQATAAAAVPAGTSVDDGCLSSAGASSTGAVSAPPARNQATVSVDASPAADAVDTTVTVTVVVPPRAVSSSSC